MKNIMIDKPLYGEDFLPLFSGEEKCESGHTFGPHIRDYYIIHFCLSGKGVLFDKYGEHKISAGELFIIRSGESTLYKADDTAPWHYLWIATLGSASEAFATLPSVIMCDRQFFGRIKETIDKNETRSEIYSSYLYELLYRSASPEGQRKADPLTKIKSYIDYNYMMNINVESISELFGFERSYLYRIFKARYSMSVKDYIIKLRMGKAAKLLAYHSVKETASLVGYSDEFAFSKAFKGYFGSSPSYYAKDSYNFYE